MKSTMPIVSRHSDLLRALLLFVVSFLILGVSDVQACTVCFNGADKALADSLNGAIFMMVGALFVVLGGIGWFVFSLVQRARNPIPDHLVLADSMNEG